MKDVVFTYSLIKGHGLKHGRESVFNTCSHFGECRPFLLSKMKTFSPTTQKVLCVLAKFIPLWSARNLKDKVIIHRSSTNGSSETPCVMGRWCFLRASTCQMPKIGKIKENGQLFLMSSKRFYFSNQNQKKCPKFWHTQMLLTFFLIEIWEILGFSTIFFASKTRFKPLRKL